MPDEIYLTLVLQGQNQLGKSLIQQEASFLDAAKRIGIPAGGIQLENISGYADSYNGGGLVSSKNYLVKVKDIEQLNALIDNLSQLNATSLNVTYLSHSKIDEHIQKARLEALNDARKEGEAIAKALDKSIVDVLEVDDYGLGLNGSTGMFTPYSAHPTRATTDDGYNLKIKNINFTYSVRVVYSMK